MLVQLSGIDLQAQTDAMEHVIVQSPPPSVYSPKVLAEAIIMNVVADIMQAWVHTEEVEGSNVVLGLFITLLSIDTTSGMKNLVVYYMTTKGMSDESVRAAVADLKEFGRNNRCNRMLYYTKDEEEIARLEQVGADASCRLVQFDISPISQNGK